MRILLIEDDESLGRAVRDNLVQQNHAVDWVTHLSEAKLATQTTAYGFILLDLRLPDGHGINFLQEMRNKKDTTPIIILTAHDQISDRIEGLNNGADDYLVKPFDLDELYARMAAISRRLIGQAKSEITINGMVINMDKKRLYIDKKEIELSGKEWAILEHMFMYPEVIVTRAHLEEIVYDFGSEIESNTVEVFVSRLRKKIGKDKIKTHHGRGYSLC